MVLDMIKTIIRRWMARRAFTPLFFICNGLTTTPQEYKEIVVVLDILRKKMSD